MKNEPIDQYKHLADDSGAVTEFISHLTKILTIAQGPEQTVIAQSIESLKKAFSSVDFLTKEAKETIQHMGDEICYLKDKKIKLP